MTVTSLLIIAACVLLAVTGVTGKVDTAINKALGIHPNQWPAIWIVVGGGTVFLLWLFGALR